MDLTTAERDRRWDAARKIMERQDVEAVIAYSDFGDQGGLQRYLSNFRSPYDYQAVILTQDTCELCVTHPGGVMISNMLSWANETFPLATPNSVSSDKSYTKGPTVGGQISNRLNHHNITKVGIIGLEYFPTGWKDTIEATVPNVSLVDVWDDFHKLRLVKGPEEIALIREACRISDLVWSKMGDIVKAGRKRYEVMADIEQIVGSQGCEDSFNLCVALPMMEKKLGRHPYSQEIIQENETLLIEVSPRFLGYYGQQTGLVSTGTVPADILHAYDSVNRAREKGLALVKPGVDLIEVGNAINAQLKADGFENLGPSFGHAVGLELEDYHIHGGSLILEEGMTFIFHPFAPGFPSVMRADTYLVTNNGFERITQGDITPLLIK